MRTLTINPSNLQAFWKNKFWDISMIHIATQLIVIENLSLEEEHHLSLSEVELHVIVEK